MAANKVLTRRKLLAGAAAACCALAGRIWYVNACEYPYPYETVRHPMGEWVDLDGAFLDNVDENTEGLSVRVQKAQVMTHDEYLDAYAYDKEQAEKFKLGNDFKSVLCLTLDLKYDADARDGFLFLGDAALIGDGRPLRFQYDPSRWKLSNPNIDYRSYYIGVVPGTETTQHIPYSLVWSQREDGRYIHDLPKISTYELVLSHAPVRHVVDITVEG